MQILIDYFIPLLVFLMMLVVGMDLTPDDFKRVRKFPKDIILGTLGQLLLLPLIGAVIVWWFEPSPIVAGGIILTTACPGGAISNYYVYLARANVALSVSLTAMSTLTAMLTLPPITAAGFLLLLDVGEQVEVPVVMMTGQLFLLLLLPTSLGMWLRFHQPRWITDHANLLRKVSMIALALMILFVIWDQSASLVSHLKELIPMAILYTLFSMAVGWSIGVLLKVDQQDRFSLMMEFGIRNLAIVTVVGATLLGNTELVIFAAAFFLIQAPLLLLLVYFQRR